MRYTLAFAGNQPMPPENDNNTNLHRVIGENRDIMLRLNETLEGLNTRQGKTSGFLWAGLLVPLLLSLLLLYLIYAVSSQAESLPAGLQGENARMERMEESLTLMTTNLEEIQAAMLSINGYMQSISHDIGRLDEADSPLVSMDSHMDRLSDSMGQIESSISSLNRNTGELKSTKSYEEGQLCQMTHLVNQITKPRMIITFY
jgi:methyl-accepting chemotaxis protein